MRVLVTGSRDGQDQALIWLVLDQLRRANPDGLFTVVHGGARGADTMAMTWVQTRRRDGDLGLYHETHRAQWQQGGKFVPSAGHQRNKHMVDKGADLVLAFWDGKSRGTEGCIRMAMEAGLTVMTYRIDNINHSEES